MTESHAHDIPVGLTLGFDALNVRVGLPKFNRGE
jgi:hypothetical protein